MKQITEQQAQSIINVLAEFPAKHTFNSIAILQALPAVENKGKNEDSSTKPRKK